LVDEKEGRMACEEHLYSNSTGNVHRMHMSINSNRFSLNERMSLLIYLPFLR
jgi:hypothetical protein